MSSLTNDEKVMEVKDESMMIFGGVGRQSDDESQLQFALFQSIGDARTELIEESQIELALAESIKSKEIEDATTKLIEESQIELALAKSFESESDVFIEMVENSILDECEKKFLISSYNEAIQLNPGKMDEKEIDDIFQNGTFSHPENFEDIFEMAKTIPVRSLFSYLCDNYLIIIFDLFNNS